VAPCGNDVWKSLPANQGKIQVSANPPVHINGIEVPAFVDPGELKISSPKYRRWYDREREFLFGYLPGNPAIKVLQDAFYGLILIDAEAYGGESFHFDLTHAVHATGSMAVSRHNEQKAQIGRGWKVFVWDMLTSLELRGLIVLVRSNHLGSANIGGRSRPGGGGMKWFIPTPTWAHQSDLGS
jgi:hypothetical protein